MRKGSIGAVLIGAIAAAGMASLAAPPAKSEQILAQQTPPTPQSSLADPDAPDQAAAPSPAGKTKPAHRAHKQAATPALQPDPDLDTDDQLAPSQMKQAVPAAVAEPVGAAARKPAHPVIHAQTDTPPPAPAAPAAAAPAAAPRPPKAAPLDAHVVACVGAFSKDSSHLRLAMTFDSKNIAFADVDSNGTKVPASVLFPNDPKHRLEVWWSKPAERRDTYLIVINGQSTWTAPGGMKLGLTLAQLEKLNHKPFKVKGFDKDGVATVSDWDGGVLATLAGGCKSGMSLRADPKASADAVAALPADQEYSSSDAAIRAVKPTVSEILIGY